MCKRLCESRLLLLSKGGEFTQPRQPLTSPEYHLQPSLVVEIVEVARDEDVDVAHDLQHVEALLQGLGGQPVVHGLKTRKLEVKSNILNWSFISKFVSQFPPTVHSVNISC